MKHKVGDKVFIKGKVINNSQFGECRVEILNAPDDDVRYMWFKDEDLEEPGSEITAEEAWELARKIAAFPSDGGFNFDEILKIFGTHATASILDSYTIQEAKERIEAWEESKNIKVGDIVKHRISDQAAVITSISQTGLICVMYDDGAVIENKDIDDFEKTGKHIDVESFLKQISE